MLYDVDQQASDVFEAEQPEIPEITAEFAESVFKTVLNAQSDIKAIDDEIATLQRRKGSLKRRIENAKEYVLLPYLEMSGQQKVKTPLGTYSRFHRTQPSLEVDVSKLPESILNNREVTSIDYRVSKTALREHLSDEELERTPGIKLVFSEPSVAIRR